MALARETPAEHLSAVARCARMLTTIRACVLARMTMRCEHPDECVHADWQMPHEHTVELPLNDGESYLDLFAFCHSRADSCLPEVTNENRALWVRARTFRLAENKLREACGLERLPAPDVLSCTLTEVGRP